MNVGLYLIILIVGLFTTILLSLEAGMRTGRRRAARGAGGSHSGMSAIEGSIFGLMGLVVAFSFHGAAERFDARRHLIVDETNIIGTAWLRLDALPAETQPALRDLFRRYLDSRLATHRNLLDRKATAAELDRSAALQEKIWQLAVAATRQDGQRTITVVFNALNEMFDIRTTRVMALRQHPPIVVFVMLWFLVCTGGFMAGHGMAGAGSGRWLHAIAFAAILSLTAYVIVDMEFPRLGLIRVDSFDVALEELRRSMDVPRDAPR